MAAGAASMSDLGDRLLKTFAGVMRKLGGLLISFGTAGLKFQASGGVFSFLSNPAAAIGVGGLLVGASKAIKSTLSDAASSAGGGGGRGARSAPPGARGTRRAGGMRGVSQKLTEMKREQETTNRRLARAEEQRNEQNERLASVEGATREGFTTTGADARRRQRRARRAEQADTPSSN
jgi:hypothetical protein